MLNKQGVSSLLCDCYPENHDCHEQEIVQIQRGTTTQGDALDINTNVSYCITA